MSPAGHLQGETGLWLGPEPELLLGCEGLREWRCAEHLHYGLVFGLDVVLLPPLPALQGSDKRTPHHWWCRDHRMDFLPEVARRYGPCAFPRQFERVALPRGGALTTPSLGEKASRECPSRSSCPGAPREGGRPCGAPLRKHSRPTADHRENDHPHLVREDILPGWEGHILRHVVGELMCAVATASP